MCILSLTAKHQNVCVTYWKWTDAAIHAVGAHSQHKDMGGTRGRMNLPVSVIRQWAVGSGKCASNTRRLSCVGKLEGTVWCRTRRVIADWTGGRKST